MQKISIILNNPEIRDYGGMVVIINCAILRGRSELTLSSVVNYKDYVNKFFVIYVCTSLLPSLDFVRYVSINLYLFNSLLFC